MKPEDKKPSKLLPFKRWKPPCRSFLVPCVFAEYWLPILPLNENRVYVFISRRTFGFNKEWDAISVNQFVTGIASKAGVYHDAGCGLSRASIKRALTNLEKRGAILVQHRKTRPNLYALNYSPLDRLGVHSYEPPSSMLVAHSYEPPR